MRPIISLLGILHVVASVLFCLANWVIKMPLMLHDKATATKRRREAQRGGASSSMLKPHLPLVEAVGKTRADEKSFWKTLRALEPPFEKPLADWRTVGHEAHDSHTTWAW
jgi:hypothetical protein